MLVLPDGATGTEGFLLPRSAVGPGVEPRSRWRELGGIVLGSAWRYGGRRCRWATCGTCAASASAVADSELVLRWRWPGLVTPPQPAAGASWVDAGQAAALLPVVVAPLVRPS